MWQADANGLSSAVEKIRAYEKKHGPRWKLSPLLERLAKDGGKLGDAKKG